jgi:hypothetical protein
VDLLELLPLLTSERLGAAPEPLLRALFERFQLQVRYHQPQNRATVRVALSDDSLDGLLTSVQDIEGGAARQDLAVSSAGAVSLAGGAPRRNRTGEPILTMYPRLTVMQSCIFAGRCAPQVAQLCGVFPRVGSRYQARAFP